ncbi:MAG: hypothetical protein ABI810_05330 [Sphingomonas bacterium]
MDSPGEATTLLDYRKELKIMAKSPSKAATKPAAEAGVPVKPKPAKPTKSASKPPATKPAATKPAATKPAATKPTATKPTATKPAAEPAALTTMSKPKKSVAPKAKAAGKASSKSVFQETSEKISQLASDILADRIVPTIEQIKAIAASALGKGETKKKKPKGKKK